MNTINKENNVWLRPIRNERLKEGVGIILLTITVALPFLLSPYNSNSNSMEWLILFDGFGQNSGIRFTDILIDLSPFLFYAAFVSFYILEARIGNRVISFFFLIVLFVVGMSGTLHTFGLLSPIICGIIPYFLYALDSNIDHKNGVKLFLLGALSAIVGFVVVVSWGLEDMGNSGLFRSVLMGAAPWEIGIGFYLLWVKFSRTENDTKEQVEGVGLE